MCARTEEIFLRICAKFNSHRSKLLTIRNYFFHLFENVSAIRTNFLRSFLVFQD